MKAILIDDEKRARISLSLLLTEYCPEIEIIAECENLAEGVKAIRKFNPQIVFLDIEMPGHSGLELLDFFNEEEIHFAIIFTTAYNEYAIQAFKFSAIDYLLKPIVAEELIEAIKRLQKQQQKKETYQLLQQNIQRENINKIAVPTANGLLFLETDHILYIKGEGAYSEIYLTQNQQHLVSRNLKNFEAILQADERFVRIHKSYIINFNYIMGYTKSDGGNLLLENNVQLPISSDKVAQILEKIQIIKR